ncbi:hypothetical protein [Poseidonocella sp. HB161398]|uniref:hypothetical protein n=1 Tax=Poseidonocella sp. HB161398 TaxID=2320855 RepID=UPI0011094D56|nr:hypothetical protein [Poseidonocella sp. HB161398]
MAVSPNLGFPLLSEGQEGAHVTANTALLALDDAVAASGGASGTLGGFLRLAVHEVELSGLSGATVTASGLIPARAIVLGVTSRTVADITGATSYDCGLSGGSDFGGSLGIAAGSENVGVVGPFATYAATDVDVTAQGGSFTGGTVRLVAHVLEMGVA